MIAKYMTDAQNVRNASQIMNPETVLYRSETPILTPVTEYERFGKVPNVVFSCGNVLINDEVLVYYGGADSVMCVATYELNELMPRK